MKRFWLLFLVSNILLFLPVYLTNWNHSSFLPFSGIRNVSIEGKLSIFFLNHNFNPFRLCIEWSIILILSIFLIKHIKAKSVLHFLLAIFWILFLLYQLYYAFMMYIYGIVPQWNADFPLIKEVLPVFLSSLKINYWVLFLGIGVIFSIIVYTSYKAIHFCFIIIDDHILTKRQYYTIAIICFILLLSTYRYKNIERYDYRLNFQWLIPKIYHCFTAPIKNHLDNLEYRLIPYNSYFNLKLNNPPNIYIIFLESYGSVALRAEALKDTMLNHLFNKETELKEFGWKIASTWSEAPIKGGRSWLSFTSVFAGSKIDNQVAYNELLNEHQDYPHLIRFLKNNQYVAHRLNTMQTNDQTEKLIPYDLIHRFHEFDTWTQHHDIPYTGYQYNPMGGIPDQYALNYVYDQNIKEKPGPHFLFFITLDSHAPFYPPPPLIDNYKLLDSITQSPDGKIWSLETPGFKRYTDAIKYQLDFTTQFIKNNGTENDLFILLGDHQPPAMEYLIKGIIHDASVPLHFITKNEKLLNYLMASDFVIGMNPTTNNNVYWSHEGIYSLLVSSLNSVYGNKDVTIPMRKRGI